MESFPYNNISSFEQQKSMMGHSITFFAAGNRVHMKWIKNGEDLAEFVKIAKARIGRSQPPGPAPQPPAPAATDIQDQVKVPSVMDQIRELSELHAAGVLTDEEFTSKKAELLTRL